MRWNNCSLSASVMMPLYVTENCTAIIWSLHLLDSQGKGRDFDVSAYISVKTDIDLQRI